MRHYRVTLPRPALVLLLLLTLTPLPIRAATVRTVDGKTYEGEVNFDAGSMVVVPRGASPLKLDLSNILQISFNSKTKAMSKPVPPPEAALGGPNMLPTPWELKDIATPKPDTVRYVEKQFRVMASGGSFHERADSLPFVCRPLSGDGTLIARVKDIESAIPSTRAGIMIRESLAPGARNVAFTLMGAPHSLFTWRAALNGPTQQSPPEKSDVAPLWLKLTRKGNTFDVYKSLDGQRWVAAGEQEIQMPPNAFWGLATASHKADATCTAVFDNVSLAVGAFGANDLNAGPIACNKAVIFRSGTIVAMDSLSSVTDKLVQFNASGGKAQSVSTHDVARIILSPLTAAMLSKIPDRTNGVLLARGDFVEGDITRYDPHHVSVSSVLFGLSSFAPFTEAVALVFAPIDPVPAVYVAQTTSGSTYMASAAKIDGDALVLEDGSLGSVRLARSDLVEFRAGEARFFSLTELKPDKVETPPGMAAAAALTINESASSAASLDSTPCAHSILTMTGTSVTYDINGQYKTFLCRAGVPDNVLPTIAVRLVVIGDGKELYRSPPRTSLDDATNLSLNLIGVKTLVLRAESTLAPAMAADLPTIALWGDPSMAK